MNLTLFGANNIKTQKYEFPGNASKKDSFKCSDCHNCGLLTEIPKI